MRKQRLLLLAAPLLAVASLGSLTACIFKRINKPVEEPKQVKKTTRKTTKK